MPVGGGKAAFDVGGREVGKGIKKAGPDRPRAVLADIFGGDARQTGVGANPLGPPAMRGAGLGNRAASLTRGVPHRLAFFATPKSTAEAASNTRACR